MKRVSILLALVVLVAAGCSSPSSSAPAGSDASAPSSPAATVAATSSPSPDASSSALPSLGEGAGDLAALLPTEVGGLTLQYSHASGDEVFDAEEMTPEAQAFLDRMGGDASRMSSAFGFAFDMGSGEDVTAISIIAFRVEGADEEELRSAFLDAIEEEGTTPIGEDTSLGGKDVTVVGFDQETDAYLYVNDDVVFMVSGEPVDLAEEALAALP